MPFHGSATADAELHNPRGVDAVPLDLTDNSATAYRVRRDDGSTYPNILSVDTTTSAVAIALGNSTDNPAITATTKALTIDVPQSTSSAVLVRRGSGDPILSIDTAATSSPHNIRVREGYVTWDEIPSEPSAVADKVHVYAYDNAGTVELRARTNAGIVNLLDTGSSLTGTTNLSWTIDENATAATDSDPFLRLLGGDGVAAPNDDLVRTTLTQDSSAESLSLLMQRSRNGGAYSDLATSINLSPTTATGGWAHVNFGGPSSQATVSINSAKITHAACVAVGSSITVSALYCVAIGFEAQALEEGAVSLGHQASARDNYGVAIGKQAVTIAAGAGGSDYAIAIGYLANGGAADVVAIGRGTATAGARSIALGVSASSSGAAAVAIGDAPIASQAGAVAIGDGASCTGADSISIGTAASVSAAESIGLGRSVSVAHANSVAIGRAAATTAANQLVLGSASYATTALFLGRGVTSATSGTTTINATGGSGTNIAGHALVLAAGASTGNAKAAALRFSVGQPGSSGSTAHTMFDAGSITQDDAASNPFTGNKLSHHAARSENITSAANYAWHVRGKTLDATPTAIWELDLANFLGGALYAAGGGMVWARVFAVGLYSGTRYSALYGRRARYETTGSAITLIDTGNTQHEGTDLEDDNGWDCEITLSTATLKITCTGDADHAVGWHIDVWVSYSEDG